MNINTSLPLADHRDREIAGSQLNNTLMVEAGAGTGKTTIMVERIVNIVKSGQAPIEQVVAITFTKKSAGELMERIRDKLLSIYIKDGNNSIEAMRCKTALDNFQNACISTIHSFAGNILRETPFDAGVGPHFQEMEEDESRTLFEESLEEWVEKELKEPDSPVMWLMSGGVKTEDFVSFASYIYNHRDVAESLPPPSPRLNIEYPLGEIISTGEQILELAEKYLKKPQDDIVYNLSKIKYILMDLREKTGEELKKYIIDLALLDNLNKGKQTSWKPADKCKEAKQLLKDFNLKLENIKIHIQDYYINHSIHRLKELFSEIENIKIKRGVLDFQDLLIKTRNLLRDNYRVREYYKQKFRFILVDEFQDTDPLQTEIVFFLCQEPHPSRHIRQWQECSLQEGKLFIVGDPKQSIYRFRRADIELYQEVKDILIRHHKPLHITVNFRSQQPIIQWVNAQFDLKIKRPADGNYQPDYIPLQYFRPGEPEQPSVYLLTAGEDMEKPISMEEARKQEGGIVAKFISEMVNERNIKIKSKKNSEKERHIRYGDWTLLYPRGTNLDIYEDALKDYNIPYILEKGKQFFQRPEIEDLINLLSAIDNPRDYLSIIASLKSPFFGLSDEDLFFIKNINKTFCYLNRIHQESQDSSLNSRSVFALDTLAWFHSLRNRISITALLEKILSHLLNREYHRIFFGDDRRIVNIEKFIQIAGEYSSKNNGTLRDFLRDINSKREGEVEEADAPITGINSDAVTLLTMHSSKGLQFPCVILINCMTLGSSEKGTRCCMDKNPVKFHACIPPFKTLNFEQRQEREKIIQKAEIVRLMYVASTRAENILAIPQIHKYNKKGEPEIGIYQECIGETLLKQPKMMTYIQEVITYNRNDLLLQEPTPLPFPHIHDDIRQPSLADEIKQWEKEYKNIIEKASLTEEITSYTREKTLQDEDVPPEIQEEDPIELRIGRVYHKIMEKIDFKKGNLPDPMIALFAGEEKLDQEKMNYVMSLVHKSLGSSWIKRALTAKRIYREYPFTVEAEIRGSRKTFQGYIDLLMEEKDGMVILDYKTDRVGKEEIDRVMKEYSLQHEIYKKAVESMNKPVKEILYYFAVPDIVKRVYEG